MTLLSTRFTKSEQIADSFKAFLTAVKYLRVADKRFWEKPVFSMPKTKRNFGEFEDNDNNNVEN